MSRHATPVVARSSAAPTASARQPFARIAARLCPPLVEARCTMIASCACHAPARDCVAREQTRCEGWIDAVYAVVGYDDGRPIVERAVNDCLAETRSSLSAPLACYGNRASRACLRVQDERYTAQPLPAFVPPHFASVGESCDSTLDCEGGLACLRGRCARVDRCTREDDDCGHAMRCDVGSGTCEPETCDPWRFWNPDAVDS